MTVFGFERGGLAQAARFERAVAELAALARERGVGADAATRQKIAQAQIEAHVFRLIGLRNLTKAQDGHAPGPEASVTKLYWSEMDKRLQEAAVGVPNPRWSKEAPPTFLVALAPVSLHLAEAEEYGKGWLNGGNRFEYLAPVLIGDRITATGRVADVYEKSGSTGNLLFIIFETDYVNQRGELVARLRGTAIRR